MKADIKVFFPIFIPKISIARTCPKVWKMFDPLQAIFSGGKFFI